MERKTSFNNPFRTDYAPNSNFNNPFRSNDVPIDLANKSSTSSVNSNNVNENMNPNVISVQVNNELNLENTYF